MVLLGEPVDEAEPAGEAELAGRACPAPLPGDRPLYGLDIETDTTVDGLDPSTSAIVAVALSTADRDHVFMGSEKDILIRLEALLRELPPGVIVTWNGSSFDLPFLADRSARCGVELSLRLRSDPAITRQRDPLPGHSVAYRAEWGAHAHLDGYLVYRADVGRCPGLSCGLKPLARLVGLAPVEVDRSLIHELTDDAVRDYVASDARIARELVIRRLPAAARAAHRPTGEWSPAEAVASCHTVSPD